MMAIKEHSEYNHAARYMISMKVQLSEVMS